MRCENCGDSISLSDAYRDDNGNFICGDCHTGSRRQRRQESKKQGRTQSIQEGQAAPDSTERRTGQNSSGEGSSATTQHARTPGAETDGGNGKAPVGAQPSERRFKTLLSISNFISGLGWVIVGLGALVGVIGVIAAMSLPPPMEEAVFALTVGLGGGIWVAVSGILIVAFGQVVSCFVAIERNTRSTLRLIQERED